MGLDMYLTAKKYISPYRKEDDEISKKIEEIIGYTPSNVETKICYWRKANAIHDWFVKNVQKGEDDCGDYFVSPQNIKELVDHVNQVLENPEKAEELLPTASGFFFGSTDYDEWYFEYLRETKETLEPYADPENPFHKEWDLFYHSSW